MGCGGGGRLRWFRGWIEQEFGPRDGNARFAVNWFPKLKASLGFSRESVAAVRKLADERRPLDADFWEEFEEMLLLADFGVPTTEKIVAGLRTVAKQELWRTSDQAVARFEDESNGS